MPLPGRWPERALRADPQRFVDVCGRRMALLGFESGEHELWMWPLKVAHGIALEARPIDRPAAEPARTSAVRVRPEALELTWVHPEFTLRQRAFAALDERALVFVIEHDGGAAVDLRLRLTPDFTPMWPAGLGGRIATRDEETGALLLTEELGRFACLVGSPQAAPVDARGDHALRSEPLALSMRLRPEPGEPLVVAFAGAELDPGPLSEAARLGLEGAATGFARAERVVAEARRTWRRACGGWRELEREQQRHWEAWAGHCARLRFSDARTEVAFRDAQVALEKAWVQVDGLGRGLVAGLGPSRGSERPGFGWFFDGDAMIAARALTDTGDFEGAREVLRFAAAHQRADGKLMHELVLSAGLCAWQTEYPYAYYKADNSPRFASVLAQLVEASGDLELGRELLPTAQRALDWMEGCLDAQGLLANEKAGLAAVEAGPLCGRIGAEVFLQGLWLDSLQALERLAGALERPDLAGRAGARLAQARAAFEGFWSEEHGRYGFARLVDGGRNDDLTAYLGHPLARGCGDPERALASARQLNHPRLVSDWGARMFAEDAEVYDPAHYNTGSVFPYLTQFVALALYRVGLPDAGFQVLSSLAALSGLGGLGFVPEHLRGDRAVLPERSVPHQIFSSAGLLQVATRGLLGLAPDALTGRLEVAPALPPGWSTAGVENLRVGETRLDLTVARQRTRERTYLRCSLQRREGPGLEVALRPVVAPLTRLGEVRANGETVAAQLAELPSGARRIELRPLRLAERLEVVFEIQSGPRLVLPQPELEEGATSHGLRLVDHRVDGDEVRFELWGFAGRSYRVPCRCDLAWESGGPATRIGDSLRLDFPPTARGGPSRVELPIRILEP